MASPKFYHRPKTVQEALSLTARGNNIALAGGAVTLDRLEVEFDSFIDLQDIPELKRIEPKGGAWVVGASCSLQQVLEIPDLPAVVIRALTRAVTLNQRNGASVGESLRQRNKFQEWITALYTLEAPVHYLLPGGAAIIDMIWNQHEGIIAGLQIPLLGEREALGSAHVARTPADAPIVDAVAFMRASDQQQIEVVFCTVSGINEDRPTQITFSLEGQPLIEVAVKAAVDQHSIQATYADYRGSAEYRAAMARVCIQRALMECVEQLKI
jgi:CO/xanthine dehydrogenase FAD-binding subunit